MSAAVEILGTAGGGRLLARRVVGFVRVLRDNGFPVGLPEAIDGLRAARAAELGRRDAVRWAFRSLLCASGTDWRRFDQIFDLYWLGHGRKQATRVAGHKARGPQAGLPGGQTPAGPLGPVLHSQRGGGLEAEGGDGRRGGAGSAESLAATDLRHINDPEELVRVSDLSERLAARMRYRLTRRERHRRRGRRLDLRRVIHNSIRFGGTPMKLAYRKRWPKPLRLVVILDASGSMSLYSTFFVRFIRGVLDHFREAEAFVFHTRLIHISAALRERDTEKALERMALMASGWDSGTKIGESLATFNRGYAASVIKSRTAVIIVSDGYDTGPPERLAAEMRQMKRRAKRIVWLNPMIGWRDYEPVAKGMSAALPFVDLFAPAHDLQSLAALEPYLAKL
ncbi:MAG: VWA domain-containing protein [Rhodospirillales bacterium]|nr:VWA domain-containing protein [Rhodospirillales bacterium]MDH3792028.1 VWA domain-containing protein [Rhodospirillales bacterium]MDH3911368.1 VWA domain-containing protein [Rhodospirillales bacterium]MDH3919619.1 VWA domain-containing protein [Rhodospirillales bacterium]MDH3967866.1 VWA domain-containing protein [Rhodospirillales bacterium]